MNKKKLLLIILFLFIIYINRTVLIYRPIVSITPTKTTYGVITEEKDLLRRGFITGAFNYYYEFSIKGKKYFNPSYNEDYKIGDTVLIEYNQYFPFMNRIKDSK